MKVSIIITCYNREKWIGRAIRSAISQRFMKGDYEVIVVDDGSTDNSRKIINDFGDEIITIFHEKNRGLPTARNTGIRKSRGRFVVHLDSDDYLDDDAAYMLNRHLAYNPELGAVACDYYIVDDLEQHIRRCYADKDPIACGILFRKELLIDIGLYDETMLLCEDEELRERFDAKNEIGFCHVPLYRYTRHDDNLTNNIEEVEKYKTRLKTRNGSKKPEVSE